MCNLIMSNCAENLITSSLPETFLHICTFSHLGVLNGEAGDIIIITIVIIWSMAI